MYYMFLTCWNAFCLVCVPEHWNGFPWDWDQNNIYPLIVHCQYITICVIIIRCTVELLYNRHHWDQRLKFCPYSEVSFAQGVIVDHASLTIMASYAGVRLWTMKSVVVMKELLLFTP